MVDTQAFIARVRQVLNRVTTVDFTAAPDSDDAPGISVVRQVDTLPATGRDGQIVFYNDRLYRFINGQWQAAIDEVVDLRFDKASYAEPTLEDRLQNARSVVAHLEAMIAAQGDQS